MTYDKLPEGMITTTQLAEEIPKTTLNRILNTLKIKGDHYKKVTKGKSTYECFYTPEQVTKIKAERERRLNLFDAQKKRFSNQWYRKDVNDISLDRRKYLTANTRIKKTSEYWKVSVWNTEHAKFQVIKCSLTRKAAFDLERELTEQGIIARASVHISQIKNVFAHKM